MTLAELSTGDVLLSMIWFFLLIVWFWLLITIFSDLFRDHSMSGWGKAGWVIFVIVLPFLGILMYLIVRGHSMQERAIQAAKQDEAATRDYIQQVAGSGGTADELAKLHDLKEKGVIDDAEYQRLKAKALA